jgi:hypothetical protein
VEIGITMIMPSIANSDHCRGRKTKDEKVQFTISFFFSLYH